MTVNGDLVNAICGKGRDSAASLSCFAGFIISVDTVSQVGLVPLSEDGPVLL